MIVDRCHCSTVPRELIETLWNVNDMDTVELLCGILELIETLWNVNTKGSFAGGTC